ncbi:ammonium transporter [Nocardia zapadnayensis]|uniref:ammonium transporter n=1 Tax=Nocardia rhamnosiphila TaxID=426716 RepID=UPI002245B124|nr:ammonium transporter [Nocardia zapadnayensis]MCX0270454.1 ammonium transporter [Nocardia zapadnayensis]
MMIRKIVAAVVPLLATTTVGAAVVHAEPATPEIGYRAELIGNRVVTTLTNGTFEIAGETVEILDNSGTTVVALPLAVREGATEYPLPHAVRDEGRVLELTAVKDVAAARPAAQPVASPQENLAAQDNFTSQLGIATAIGGFVGTALGAVVGLATWAGGPVTGIPGIVTAAALGGIIGTIVVGGPTLIIAGIDLINTLVAAPGTTQWAPRQQVQPAN